MTLLAVREIFGKRSGRYDLVDPTAWTDLGADVFINAGIKHLDKLVGMDQTEATLYKTLAVGDWYTYFQNSRSIHEVWVSTTEEKWPLDEKDRAEMKEYYGDVPTEIDNGRPLFYYPTNLRTSPDDPAKITVSKFGSTAFEITAVPYTYNGLIFLPPADDTYTLEVVGNFYSPQLVNETDENYWTLEYPLVVVMAAMREVEIMYRNSEGVKDWDAAIYSVLTELDKDMVAQESANIRSMEGGIK
jgi:hypothetical protein